MKVGRGGAVRAVRIGDIGGTLNNQLWMHSARALITGGLTSFVLSDGATCRVGVAKLTRENHEASSTAIASCDRRNITAPGDHWNTRNHESSLALARRPRDPATPPPPFFQIPASAHAYPAGASAYVRLSGHLLKW